MHIVGGLFLCTDDGVCKACGRPSHNGEGFIQERGGAGRFHRYSAPLKRKDRL